MIPVDQALEIVLAEARALAFEDVALDRGARAHPGGRSPGRRRPAPLRPLRHGRLRGAGGRRGAAPCFLPVVGQIRAGQAPGSPLRSWDRDPDHDRAPLFRRVRTRCSRSRRRRPRPMAFGSRSSRECRRARTWRRAGSEVRAGDTVVEAGRAIDPATLAVLRGRGPGPRARGPAAPGRGPRHRRRARGRRAGSGPGPHPQQQWPGGPRAGPPRGGGGALSRRGSGRPRPRSPPPFARA